MLVSACLDTLRVAESPSKCTAPGQFQTQPVFRGRSAFSSFILDYGPSPFWGYSSYSTCSECNMVFGFRASEHLVWKALKVSAAPLLWCTWANTGTGSRRDGSVMQGLLPWPSRPLHPRADAQTWERLLGTAVTFMLDLPLSSSSCR